MADKIGQAVGRGVSGPVVSDKIGKLFGKSTQPSTVPPPALSGATLASLLQLKMQEMQREVTRLAAAIQQEDRARRAMVAGGADLFGWQRASDEVRGWILSLVESQAYIEFLTEGSYGLKASIQQVLAKAGFKADAQRRMASRSVRDHREEGATSRPPVRDHRQ